MVANIKALMKARGVTRAELARRMNALGFTTWQWAKTLRNLFDGKRSIRVNELFGLAAALNTSASALTGLDTHRAVYGRREVPTVEVCVGSSWVARFQYLSLWYGKPGAAMPTELINWAAWEPGREPFWVHNYRQVKEHLIEMYEVLGEPLPAKASDLTPEDVFEMGRRLRTISGELEE